MPGPDFDVYHRWLGIPVAEQPANLYRLLGLSLFEDDPEVIADAAERQVGHIRKYAQGQFGDEANRLLGELSQARVILEDRSRKLKYDKAIREADSEQTEGKSKPVLLIVSLFAGLGLIALATLLVWVWNSSNASPNVDALIAEKEEAVRARNEVIEERQEAQRRFEVSENRNRSASEELQALRQKLEAANLQLGDAIEGRKLADANMKKLVAELRAMKEPDERAEDLLAPLKTGKWSATFQQGDSTGQFELELTESQGERLAWDGQLTANGDKNSTFELESVSWTGGQLAFEVEALAVVFKGKLDVEQNSVEGVFSKGGTSFPLKFSRVTFDPAVARLEKDKPGGEPEDNLPKAEVASTESSLSPLSFKGHETKVTSVVFSPDGTRIASENRSGYESRGGIKLWDVGTGEEIATLVGYTATPTYKKTAASSSDISRTPFSPDGSRIVTKKVNTHILWDANSGEKIRSLEGHSKPITCFAFSPVGKFFVTGSEDMSLKLWSLNTGEVIKDFRGHEGIISSVAFGPEGLQIVSGSEDSLIKIWDVQTGREVKTLQGHSKAVLGVAVGSGGEGLSRIASISAGNEGKLWDMAKGIELANIEGTKGIAFSPDGGTVAAVSNTNVYLYDAKSGSEVARIETRNRGFDFAFSPDGKKVAASVRKSIGLWDTRTGERIGDKYPFFGRQGAVSAIAFSADGSLVAVCHSEREKIALVDAATGERIKEFSGHRGPGTCVAFAPEGFWFVSGSDDKTLRLWNAK